MILSPSSAKNLEKTTPPQGDASATAEGIEAAEVDKFSKLAAEWWNPEGKFKPLHKFNPVRVAYLRDALIRQFARDYNAERPLEGLSVLDVGCGGGLLCEPLARLGANVTGADPSRETILAAEQHAKQMNLTINYRITTAEGLAKKAESYDLVAAMEVVEHVPDVNDFLAACSKLVKPGGLLVVATINRTLKSFALAIVGAEYILRWLPRGTHTFDKFVTPEEISRSLHHTGLHVLELQGVIFNPLFLDWRLSKDLDVNYMALAERPK